MRTPKTLLIAGTLVLVSLSSIWWNQRTVANQHTPSVSTTTAHVAERIVTPKITALPAPAPAPAPALAPTHAPAPAPAPKPRTKALQSPENITAQHFRLRADRDTLLHSKGGCTVKLPANAFVNAHGVKVKGAVDLQLREVLKPVDFVMGNMVTVYKGKALESGGSFCLEAEANGEALALADGKLIDMAIPTRGAKSGIKVFPGKVEGDAVEWLQPRDLMMPEADVNLENDKNRFGQAIIVDSPAARTNAWIRLDKYPSWEAMPTAMQDDLMKICWGGDGLMITKDSTVLAGGEQVVLTPWECLAE